MKRVFFSFFTIWFLSFSSLAQNESDAKDCTFIFAGELAFYVKAPSMWKADCDAGFEMNLLLALHPKNETWSRSQTVMYINSASLQIEGQKTLTELIQYDEDKFRKNYPSITVEDKGILNLRGSKRFLLKYFGGESYGNYETIAYLDEGLTGILFVLSSRTKSGHDESYSSFLELLNSYSILSKKE